MALTSGQQNAMRALKQRQQAGTIKAGGLARLDALRAAKNSGQPAVQGGILKQQQTPAAPPGPVTPSTGVPGADTTLKQTPGVAANTYGDISQVGQNVLPGVADAAFNPIDFKSLSAAPQTQDLAADRQKYQDMAYQGLTQGFDEQKARDKQAFDQQMQERGIAPGSGDAYDSAYKSFEKSWNDRYDKARYDANNQGLQEWQQAFNIGTEGRANELGEQVLGRQFPLQQYTGLMGLGNQAGQVAATFRGQNMQKKIAKLQAKVNKQIAEKGYANAMAIAKLQAATALAGRGGGDGLSPPPPAPEAPQ